MLLVQQCCQIKTITKLVKTLQHENRKLKYNYSSPKYMIMFLHLVGLLNVCIAKKLVLLFHHLVLFQSKVFLFFLDIVHISSTREVCY